MNRIRKRILRIGIMVGVAAILFIAVGGFIAYKITKYNQLRKKAMTLEAHELTEKDKEFLNRKYPEDADNIEAGMLYPYQYGKLESARKDIAYLEEKYPGYGFVFLHINGDADLFGGFGKRNKSSYRQSSWCLMEETSGREVTVHQWIYEDGTVVLKDNFYGYGIEEDYAAYYKEQLEQRIDGVVEVRAHISDVHGDEYDSSTTAQDIIDGKFDVQPDVTISLSADGRTEEECEAFSKSLVSALREITGQRLVEASYKFNYSFYEGTEEEILNRKENELVSVYHDYKRLGNLGWE